MTSKKFQQKVRIRGKLVFSTAFHIGSGREGELATDMGILRDESDRPLLPGSSLKGNFRSLAEKLAPYLKMSACQLDDSLSGIECVNVETYRRKVQDEFRDLSDEAAKIAWLQDHTCDACRLFGSPMQTSRIFFSDGQLLDWAGSTQVRDGVCIDRDTETAREGLKFDFEVAPTGAVYGIQIDLENPTDTDLALVGAVLAEWQNGFRLGGFTTRGLGQVSLTDLSIEQVSFDKPAQIRDYLINRKMTTANDLLSSALQKALGN